MRQEMKYVFYAVIAMFIIAGLIIVGVIVKITIDGNNLKKAGYEIAESIKPFVATENYDEIASYCVNELGQQATAEDVENYLKNIDCWEDFLKLPIDKYKIRVYSKESKAYVEMEGFLEDMSYVSVDFTICQIDDEYFIDLSKNGLNSRKGR